MGVKMYKLSAGIIGSGGGPVIDLLHMIDLSLYFMEFPEPDEKMGRERSVANFVNTGQGKEKPLQVRLKR